MGIPERWSSGRFGPPEGLALVIAGVFGLLTDAVSTAPTWAEGWGWVVVFILSAILIAPGVILIFRAPESSGHRLARLFRPLIGDGQMLYQDAGLPDAHPDDIHRDFVERVAKWESRATAKVARYADDYSDVLSQAISGDVYFVGVPGWRLPFDSQRRRLDRSLKVLRALADGTLPKDIDLDAAGKVTAAVEAHFADRLEADGPGAPTAPKTSWTAAQVTEQARERASVWHLRDEGHRRIERYESMSLDELVRDRADEWLDKWTSDARRVLAPDTPGLARFNEPIDAISGQDWRLRPLTMLRVRLTRLEEIAGDEYFEGPKVAAETPDPDDLAEVTTVIPAPPAFHWAPTFEVEQAVLKALRDLLRKQAKTSAILALDLMQVAESVGATRDTVQDALIDLLAAGKAEGYAETFTDHKEDGHCRITALGMASIRD
jgi:hypothetical protein